MHCKFPFDFFFRLLLWIIFKVYIEFVIILLLSYVLFFFGCKVCGMLASLSLIKPAPPAMEGKVLTSGLLGMSSFCFLNAVSY